MMIVLIYNILYYYMQSDYTTPIENDPVLFSRYNSSGNHHDKTNCNDDFYVLVCALNGLMANGDKGGICRKLTRCILARQADNQGVHDQDHATTIEHLTILRDRFCKSNLNTANFFFYTDNHSIQLVEAITENETLYNLAQTHQCLSSHSANISETFKMSRDTEYHDMRASIDEERALQEERERQDEEDAYNYWRDGRSRLPEQFEHRSRSHVKSLKHVSQKGRSNKQTKTANHHKEARQNLLTDRRLRRSPEDGEVKGGRVSRKLRKSRRQRRK